MIHDQTLDLTGSSSSLWVPGRHVTKGRRSRGQSLRGVSEVFTFCVPFVSLYNENVVVNSCVEFL